MREIRLYGSEGGGATALPTPIPCALHQDAHAEAEALVARHVLHLLLPSSDRFEAVAIDPNVSVAGTQPLGCRKGCISQLVSIDGLCFGCLGLKDPRRQHHRTDRHLRCFQEVASGFVSLAPGEGLGVRGNPIA